MRTPTRSSIVALGFLFAGLFAAAPAGADKPAWAGGGKAAKSQQKETRTGRGESGAAVGRYFDETRRTAVREYYGEQVRGGHCPPGLAKKNNGCLPPGQAKRWTRGQPLPSDVVFHDLPHEIVSRLGPPPSGHRFVRVASDILLIAIGTGMVLDALEDLGLN